jgi:hypothetical protein
LASATADASNISGHWQILHVDGNVVFSSNTSVINGLVSPPEPGVVDSDSSELRLCREQQHFEVGGEPFGVAPSRPAAHVDEELVELGARECPHGLCRGRTGEAEWPVRRERIDDRAEVSQTLGMEQVEKVCELRLCGRCCIGLVRPAAAAA